MMSNQLIENTHTFELMEGGLVVEKLGLLLGLVDEDTSVEDKPVRVGTAFGQGAIDLRALHLISSISFDNDLY